MGPMGVVWPPCREEHSVWSFNHLLRHKAKKWCIYGVHTDLSYAEKQSACQEKYPG